MSHRTPTSGRFVIASKSRIGRIRLAVRRESIVGNQQPITIRQVLERAYPRLKRFVDFQHNITGPPSASFSVLPVISLLAGGSSRQGPSVGAPLFSPGSEWQPVLAA